MTTYTERTQAWLDECSLRGVDACLRGGYVPRYRDGDRLGRIPVGHVIALARSVAVLRALAGLDFRTCLDVGCGSGRLAHLIERRYGARCTGVDLARQPAAEARRDLGVPTYVADAAALPFGDGQFDLVVCSEVIEHVEHPLAVLAELWRVARRAVVVTTQEGCRSRWRRRLCMAAAERTQPHAERNYFAADDFAVAFGGRSPVVCTGREDRRSATDDRVSVRALLHVPERIRLFRRETVSDLAACLTALTADTRLRRGSFGLLVTVSKQLSLSPHLPSSLSRTGLSMFSELAIPPFEKGGPGGILETDHSDKSPSLPLFQRGKFPEGQGEGDQIAAAVGCLHMRGADAGGGGDGLVRGAGDSPLWKRGARGDFGDGSFAQIPLDPPFPKGEVSSPPLRTRAGEGAGDAVALVIDLDRRHDALAAERAADPFAGPAAGDLPLLTAPRPVCPECRGALGARGATALTCAACDTLFPAPDGVPRLLGSPTAIDRSRAAWAARSELEPLRRALARPPLPGRRLRRVLRWLLRAGDFARCPLPVRDKARIAWRYRS